MNVHTEPDDIYRLYVREWVTVHTVEALEGLDVPGALAYGKATQWAHDNLGGRVREQDIRIILNTDLGSRFWANIQVFKDNLKGEYKVLSAAELAASIKKYDEYTIVPRNSPADHEIRSYGVAKL